MGAWPPLTTDLGQRDRRPYFLWDEELTVGELVDRLQHGSEPERLRLLAKIMREARDDEVWQFTTPAEVARLLPRLAALLGRRKPFWEFLIQGWRDDGLIQ